MKRDKSVARRKDAWRDQKGLGEDKRGEQAEEEIGKPKKGKFEARGLIK